MFFSVISAASLKLICFSLGLCRMRSWMHLKDQATDDFVVNSRICLHHLIAALLVHTALYA